MLIASWLVLSMMSFVVALFHIAAVVVQRRGYAFGARAISIGSTSAYARRARLKA